MITQDLYLALHFPIKRHFPDMGSDAAYQNTETEISRDEVNFARHVGRQVEIFSQILYDVFTTELYLLDIDDVYRLNKNFVFNFNKSNLFEQYKVIENMKAKNALMASAKEMLQDTPFYSDMYIFTKYGGMTDADFTEMLS